jgi:hypothetical protein
MGKPSFLTVVLILVVGAIAPYAHAQSNSLIFEPERGGLQLGIGYQYQNYNVLGRKVHTNGINTDVSIHIFDLITGASARLAVAAEGTAAVGFGNTGGVPNLDAKSLFLGGGPHISLENSGRIEPWVHALPGWQHFRFTQSTALGSNSTFGFMTGGGLDIRLGSSSYWRVQADYIGTTFASSEQSSYSVGSGIIFYF